MPCAPYGWGWGVKFCEKRLERSKKPDNKIPDMRRPNSKVCCLLMQYLV